MNINLKGTPFKSNSSLRLFNKYRLYDSSKSPNKFVKNTNVGGLILTCVQYFIFITLPDFNGGGFFCCVKFR